MEAKSRVAIEGMTPEIDGGRFPVKRTAGDVVVVECDAFADGHDLLAGVLRYRWEGERRWSEVPLTPLDNDRWRGTFAAAQIGRYRYTVDVWIDRFATWARDLGKRIEAGQDVRVDLRIGAELVRDAGRRARGPDAARLTAWADRLDT